MLMGRQWPLTLTRTGITFVMFMKVPFGRAVVIEVSVVSDRDHHWLAACVGLRAGGQVRGAG